MSTLLCVTRCHRPPLPRRQTHAIDLKSGRYGKFQRYCLSKEFITYWVLRIKQYQIIYSKVAGFADLAYLYAI